MSHLRLLGRRIEHPDSRSATRHEGHARRSSRLISGLLGVAMVAAVVGITPSVATAGTPPVTPTAAWAKQTPTKSPPARYGASMAYDPSTGNMVLFGGTGSTSTLNDTWTYNGSTWTQAIDTGCTSACTNSPSTRAYASMAYDPATGNMVLFGGIKANGTNLNDTWTYNGSTWTQVDDSSDAGCTTSCTDGPPGRVFASMAFDPATGNMVLFGGFGGSGSGLNDTWTWNGSTWTQVDDSGDASCTASCTNSPPARDDASMAYDPASGNMVLFGGYSSSGPLNDTWIWNGTTWTQVDDSTDSGCTINCANSPPARSAASMSYDPATGNMVLFGGSDASNGNLNDTWTWSGTTWTQVDDSSDAGCTTSCTDGPPGRVFASMAFDPATGNMVLFGGYRGNSYLADTWTYGYPPGMGTDWAQQSPTKSPSARAAASMAYDPATGNMVLFGGFNGFNGSSITNDTWIWNGTTWTQVVGTSGCATNCSNSPPARDFASMAYDPATGNMLLFGGEDSSNAPLNDTWIWNGTKWTQVDDSGDTGCTISCTNSPPARAAASMAYDPATGNMVLFGGYNGSSYLNDTWAWNGTTWTQVVGTSGCAANCSNSPPARDLASMAYDPATGNMVLFGGEDSSSYLNDTWTYNGTTWTQAIDTGCTTNCTNSPSKRAIAPMAYDPATGNMVLFGGDNSANGPLGGTWTWNGTTWAKQSPSTSPPARFSASMAYDPAAGNMVLFGGYSSSGPLNDTWAYQATATVPTAPTGLAATSGDAQVSLSWTAPSSDGGSTITGYNVYEGTSSGGESSTPVNSSLVTGTSYTVTSLTNGTKYYFTVEAVNSVGSSSASNEVSATPAATVPTAVVTVPSAPRDLSATSGDAQVSLSWTAPSSTGGSAITGYNVYKATTSGGEPATPVNSSPVTGTSYTVTSLTNGTKYYFTVEAVNSVGSSSASNEVSATPAATIPSAPSGLTATAGNGQVALSWVAPSSSGDGTVIGYDVYEGTSPGGELSTPINGSTLITATSYTVKGLTNGTTYYFTVEAVNSSATSPASSQASATPTLDATTPTKQGYWEVAANGAVFSFGDATYHGSLPGLGISVSDIVGMAATPDGGGYWLVGSNGAVYSFGDAAYRGSLPGMKISVSDIVGMAATPGGGGYWLVGSNGAVYSFGDAAYHGSLPGLKIAVSDIVGMASAADGGGYRLVSSNGGVFAFGDADYHGSLPGLGVSVNNITTMVPTATGGGYWQVSSDGGIFAFGNADYDGSLPGLKMAVNSIVGAAVLSR